MSRTANPFRHVRKWRAKDQHTGIDKVDGVPYTYRHLAGRRPPAPRAEVYRVETFIPFAAPTAIHIDCYYVPGNKLDAFFDGWEEHLTTVIDIRPMTAAEALAEIALFRASAEECGD